MLETQSAGVRIGEANLLHGIDVAFRAGEVSVIVGPNGAGKSTLLGILSGELRPSSGRVLLDSVSLTTLKPKALARRRAVLPQSSNLNFHFTVEEVVRLGSTVHEPATRNVDLDGVVADALQQAGIHHLRDRFVPSLSGGERQRTHFARCLAQLDPAFEAGGRVLLLDEPTANLDPAHQHHMMNHARRLADEGCIVVAVIHDLNLAAAYGDTLVILDRGRLDFFGSTPEGLAADRIARVFDIQIQVIDHPVGQYPLIITLGPTDDVNSISVRSSTDP